MILRKKTNALRRRFQRTTCDEQTRENRKQEYLTGKKTYESAIRKAKFESWKQYCNVTNSSNPWNAAYKVASGKLKHGYTLSTLRKTDGTYTSNIEDTMECMMDSFTPADSECEDDNHHKNIRREITSPPNTTNDRPFTSIEVKSILNRMDSTKAPGENGITVDIFLRVFNIFPNTTTTIYNECLERGCFPRIWKKSNIIPVIKPGKEDEEDVEKFRPISLINIQAKVLEKLLINRIMFHMHSNNLLSNRQYGFTPQTSTVDALMLLKQHVQESITNKQCVVLISLDVKGAFDAAWWPSILKTLKDLKCPANLYNLSKSYLSERIATLSANNIAIQRSTSKGCPQGSCIGPGFWNLQYDSLLKLPYTKHTEVIAFADDFMMIIRGSNLTEIEHYANIEMLKVTNWARQNKITFNDRKSKLLLITRKNQNSERGLTVYLNNRKLDQTKQMKYLGVTIDSKFSFNQHIEQITQKCTKLIHALANQQKLAGDLTTTCSRLYILELYFPCCHMQLRYGLMQHVVPTTQQNLEECRD